jgi:endo-1,4-beta-xylanase
MTDTDILSGADWRIREHRSADVGLRFRDESGRPLAGATAQVEMVRHEFKFGANAFGLFSIPDADTQRAYEERFAALLNFATLPFYWGGYEPKRDAPCGPAP